MTRKITVTAIVCPMCDDTPWSRDRHDLRRCRCGYCFIDGGRDYTRMGWGGADFPEPWTIPQTVKMEVDQRG